MKRFFGMALLTVLGIILACVSARAVTIQDAAGKAVTVSPPYQRIISLYGAHTENLFALGLNKQIIGVSRHEAYPPEATEKPAFSYHDDAERFLAAHPDLVLVRPMITRGYPNLMEKLRKAGITVVSLQPRTVQEMFAYWKTLGVLTGREKSAEKMIRRFKDQVAAIRKRVARIPLNKRKRVYFESIHSRMKTFAPSSIAIYALKTAGGIDVATDAKSAHGTNIADYGKERILSHANEIDVFLAQHGAMNHVTQRRIYEEAGFEAIKAVKNHQVFIIDEMIVSRPTPRLILGITQIGRFLYPSIFNDVSDLKQARTLSRAGFAEMFVKMAGFPFETPGYRRIRARKKKGQHLYGDFRDVDYHRVISAYIETAVERGLFQNIRKGRFFPDKPIRRRDIAYSLFVGLDLPEGKPCKMLDVPESDPDSAHIEAVAGLGIMKLKQGKFFPDGTVSGLQAYRILQRALKLTEKKGNSGS